MKKSNLSNLQKVVLSVIACIFVVFSILLVPIAFVLGGVVSLYQYYYDTMSKALSPKRDKEENK